MSSLKKKPTDDRPGNLDLSVNEAIRNRILVLLGNRRSRLTPLSLERTLCSDLPGLSRHKARAAIKDLVADGILLYTNHFNTTHLELNVTLPIQVSERIVLSPHTCSGINVESKALIIKLDQGGAFGIGDHPTTRLALRGVDWVMGTAIQKEAVKRLHALDIGTGSGVLAMAAVGLGACRAWAIDIDPAALHEADRNIRLNAMAHKIQLTAVRLEALADICFDVIMANLRPPTLKEMLTQISVLSAPEAYWVFSGYREDAHEQVAEMLPLKNARMIWQEASCGWAALVVKYSRA